MFHVICIRDIITLTLKKVVLVITTSQSLLKNVLTPLRRLPGTATTLYAGITFVVSLRSGSFYSFNVCEIMKYFICVYNVD